MRANEFRGRNPEDLRSELNELRGQLFNLRFQWQAEENPDVSRARKLRQDIARILTVLREMELAEEREQTTRSAELQTP